MKRMELKNKMIDLLNRKSEERANTDASILFTLKVTGEVIRIMPLKNGKPVMDLSSADEFEITESNHDLSEVLQPIQYDETMSTVELAAEMLIDYSEYKQVCVELNQQRKALNKYFEKHIAGKSLSQIAPEHYEYYNMMHKEIYGYVDSYMSNVGY